MVGGDCQAFRVGDLSIPREPALAARFRIGKSEPECGGFVNPPRACFGCSVRIGKSEPECGGFVNPPRACFGYSVRIGKSEPECGGFVNPPRACFGCSVSDWQIRAGMRGIWQFFLFLKINELSFFQVLSAEFPLIRLLDSKFALEKMVVHGLPGLPGFPAPDRLDDQFMLIDHFFCPA